jgi:hypothetical protein
MKRRISMIQLSGKPANAMHLLNLAIQFFCVRVGSTWQKEQTVGLGLQGVHGE